MYAYVGGLEAFVEYCDPAFPVLKRMAHETVKLGADNPDNYYFNAQISGKYSYRLNLNDVPLKTKFLRLKPLGGGFLGEKWIPRRNSFAVE